MRWVVANIHRIMILSGLLTMTMIYAALAPEAALRSTFGESVSGPVADIVVRNWGAMIALVGAARIGSRCSNGRGASFEKLKRLVPTK
jgi:hypothetical protein